MNIKDILEEAIQIVLNELRTEGININVPLIKRKISIFKNNFLKEYKNIKIAGKINKTIQIENIIKKETTKLRNEISKIQPKTEIIKETTKEIIKPQIIERIIEKENNKKTEDLGQELERLKNVHLKHIQLLEIGVNDHHLEKHILESHLDSEWKKKFERLISGGITDDLHKHTYELPPAQTAGPYIDISGAYQPKTTAVSADYTVRETDDVLLVNATSGNIEIKLEQAIYRKSILIIKNVSTAGSNTITITPNGSEQIDNAANYTMNDLNESVILVSDSSDWWTQRGETATAFVSDTAYAASWDGVTDIAPSKNAVYDKIESLHVAVTLDANADTLLSLSTQALGLDTQTSNLVFAGPTTGAAAVPTFRSLVAGDIPDLSGTYQPLDADLTAIAALGFTATAFLKKTAANTWALDTNTYLTSVTAHDILSATHGDTTAAAVVRGDIIIGSGVSPKWTRLAVGASTTYLAGGTEPSWATLNQAAVAGLTTADSPTFAGLTLTGNLVSSPAGIDIGSTLTRFDGYFNTLASYTNLNLQGVVTGNVIPVTNNSAALGDEVTPRRWADVNSVAGDFSGHVDINTLALGGATIGDDALAINWSPVNDNLAHVIEIALTPSSTITGTYNNYALNFTVTPAISSGVTDSGQKIGIIGQALGSSTHAGTLASMYGNLVNYGHNTGTLGTTNNAYGFWVRPYHRGGTIDNMYSLYFQSAATGGTVTNKWDMKTVSGWNWWFASDNQKIRMGATEGDFDLYFNATNAVLETAVGDFQVVANIDATKVIRYENASTATVLNGNTSVAVTFPTAFSVAPVVVATPMANVSCWITSITTTGCTINIGSAAGTAGVIVNYIAMEET